MSKRKEIREYRSEAEGVRGASDFSCYLPQDGEFDLFSAKFETQPSPERSAVKLNPQHLLSDHLSYISINVIGTGQKLKGLNSI